MNERRRVDGRTRRQKAAVVGRAEVIGTLPAAREAGVPESTVRYWRSQPAFAELREQKKEEVALDVWAAFQEGVQRIRELIPVTEDMGKVAVATGIIFDKFALMSGAATSRSETRTVTDKLDDHEREALADAIEGWLEKAPKARRTAEERM